MRRRNAAALVAVPLVAGSVASGITLTGRDEPEPPTAAEVYAAALEAGTARVTLRTEFDPGYTAETSGATATGVADLRNASSTLHVTVHDPDDLFGLDEYDAVAAAGVTYLRGPRGWVSYPTATDPAGRAPSHTVDQILLYVRDSGTAWFPLADETADGRTLRRFRGTPPYLGGATVDVWVDGDDRPVRVEYAVPTPVPTTRLRVRAELTDFGTAADVRVPAGAKAFGDVAGAHEAVGL